LTRAFDQHRIEAAKEFLQTIVVIDNEIGSGVRSPSHQPSDEQPPHDGLTSPGRADTRPAKNIDQSQAGIQSAEHRPPGTFINAQSITAAALEIDLHCVVFATDTSNHEAVEKVKKVAKRADVLSIDWQMGPGGTDGGKLACEMINAILDQDRKANGRLRLIAIYTSEPPTTGVLEKAKNALNQPNKEYYEPILKEDGIIGKKGLRIVYAQKGEGEGKIKDVDLPQFLLERFATVSDGLLSSVALHSIAAVRDATHHIVSKFHGCMDIPYLHHRALLENPDDAPEYAVGVVLSELKSAVDKRSIGTRTSDKDQVKARLDELLSDENLTFQKGNKGDTISIKRLDAFDAIVNGLDLKKLNLQGKDSKKETARRQFSSIFFDGDQEKAFLLSKEFAVLSSISMHPQSFFGDSKPRVGLGSVLRGADNTYWVCLQASCDAVRAEHNTGFFFVPYEKASADAENAAEEYILDPKADGTVEIVGISPAKRAYMQSKILHFPAYIENGRVYPKYKSRDRSFELIIGRDRYLWVGNFKQRRAQRIANQVLSEVVRIGFDEFEVLRRKKVL